MITWENYEEYIMMYGDGELSAGDEAQLMQFIDQHPELKAELVAYSAARCIPDDKIVYGVKELLLKPVPAKRIIVFPDWRRYAIAAGVAAMVFISVFKWEAIRTTDNMVVVNNVQHPQPGHKILDTQATIAIAAAHVNAVDKQKGSISPKQVFVKKREKIQTAEKIAEKSRKRQDNANIYIMTKTEIEDMPQGEIKQISAINKEEAAEPIAVPSADIAVNEKADKSGFLSNLPLDEANRSQVKTIKKAVASVRRHVRGISIHLAQESIAINF